jgi:hypothetical protein
MNSSNALIEVIYIVLLTVNYRIKDKISNFLQSVKIYHKIKTRCIFEINYNTTEIHGLYF